MPEADKAVVRRIYDELFNEGRLEVADDVIAADAIEHSPPPGFSMEDVRAGLKDFTRMLRGALPDLRITVDHILAEGDMVAVYATVTGTHQGELMGVPASGAQVSFPVVDFVRVVNGLCTEHWGVEDNLALMQQIGAVPRP